MTVVLDTNLTPELVEEGFVREIISKIQTMRKEAGFEVMDRITVSHAKNEKLAGIFERNDETIRSEVLADAIVSGTTDGYVKEWSINGDQVELGVKKNSLYWVIRWRRGGGFPAVKKQKEEHYGRKERF